MTTLPKRNRLFSGILTVGYVLGLILVKEQLQCRGFLLEVHVTGRCILSFMTGLPKGTLTITFTYYVSNPFKVEPMQ